jgi:hypothetical protein
MVESIKQLLLLVKNTKKDWLIPVILFFIIVAMLIIASQIVPIPFFIYPIV